MLNRLKSWLSAGAPPDIKEPDGRRLAAATLLAEAAALDGHFGAAERTRIERLLAERFGLDDAEARTLTEAGEEAQAHVVELFGVTRRAAQGLSEDERIGLIEMLWEVVYADGVEHAYESNLVRRVTGLLHVSDRASGEARRRVIARYGSRQGEWS